MITERQVIPIRVTCDEIAGVARRKPGALMPPIEWSEFVVYGAVIAVGAVTALLILSPSVKWLEQLMGRIF